jgi:hypothetical protein
MNGIMNCIAALVFTCSLIWAVAVHDAKNGHHCTALGTTLLTSLWPTGCCFRLLVHEALLYVIV